MIKVEVEFKKTFYILHLSGDLHFESLDHLINIWSEIVFNEPQLIAINCANLKTIDSAAIGTLVYFFNDAMRKNIKLIFYDLNSSIKRLFNSTHLEDFFTVTSKDKFLQQYLSCASWGLIFLNNIYSIKKKKPPLEGGLNQPVYTKMGEVSNCSLQVNYGGLLWGSD